MATAPSTRRELIELLRKSNLIDQSVLDRYLARKEATDPLPDEPKQLAKVLIQDGLLTIFQASQLLSGRHKGFQLGKYRVLEKLGSGGMGAVYLAEHVSMRRRVAIKVLPPAKNQDAVTLERFYREARAAAAVDHPNIVHAFDIDCDNTVHFLVMEYVDGVSLQTLTDRLTKLPIERACHYIRQTACGLQAVHAAGLVHRDIKPANLLLDRQGVVKILDLGLARFHGNSEDELTKQHDMRTVLGTADYLSPEQALNSSEVDGRSDIYSLGVTFFFLLTGRTPFGNANLMQKLFWHQTCEPPSVRTYRPEVPEALAAIIARMLAKDPARRYQSAAEVVAELADWTRIPIAPPADDEIPKLSPAAMAAGLGAAGLSTATNLAVTTQPHLLNRAPHIDSMPTPVTPMAPPLIVPLGIAPPTPPLMPESQPLAHLHQADASGSNFTPLIASMYATRGRGQSNLLSTLMVTGVGLVIVTALTAWLFVLAR